MNLNVLFEEVHKHFSKFPNKDIIDHEIEALEQFIEDDQYLFEQLKTQLPEIEQDYLSRGHNPKYTTPIFQRLTEILDINPNKNNFSSIKKKANNKLLLFTKLVPFLRGAKKHSKQISVSAYIPKEYRLLYSLEIISMESKLPISEWLITGYHQSGMDINQFTANNELFKQLQCSNTVATKIACNTMKNYIIEYEKSVSKPLPYINKKISIDKYSDNINITAEYMVEINTSMNRILNRTTSYPIQLDVFFVAPETHQQLNLHALGGLDGVKSDIESRKHAAAISDVYRLMRAVAIDINQAHGQRFIMLIVRGNQDDTCDDTIYIFKPPVNNYIADKHVSDYVELMYLLNSKSMIVPGLSPCDVGVLGFTHHLHAEDCNKVYISYGDYKSRVFKSDILSKLKLLFNWHNEKRHIIEENTETEFLNGYQDFQEAFYTEIGEYWFDNNKSYECFEPVWDSDKCISDNVYIPNDVTFHDAVNQYIDEQSEYKTNRLNEIKIDDSQTTWIKFSNHEHENEIFLIKTELKKNKEPLYIVAEPNITNRFDSKLWKIRDHKNICDVLITIEQLTTRFGIFGVDLPKTKPKKQKLNPTAPIFKPSKEYVKTNLRSIKETPFKPNNNNGNASKMNATTSKHSGEISECKSSLCSINEKPDLIQSNCNFQSPPPLPIIDCRPTVPTPPICNQILYSKIPPNKGNKNIEQKQDTIKPISKTLFAPNYPPRARLNIFIHKELTLKLLNMICESFTDTRQLYYYIDISTALQINDKQMCVFDINGNKTVFVNYDLHNKRTNDILYGVVGLNDNTPHKSDDNNNDANTKWKWKLYHFLTAKEIFDQYGISGEELPKSSRKMDKFMKELNIPCSVLNNINPMVIMNTNWSCIEQIKSAKKNKNKNKRVCRLNMRSWINQCKKSWNNLPAIPIVIIDKNIDVYKHWIEWVKLVRFNGNKYIALSCKYTNGKWEVTYIILDKGDILNKHRLIGLNQYEAEKYSQCLRYFNTKFTRIQWRE